MKIKTVFIAIVAAIIVLCQILFMSSAIAYPAEIPVRQVPFPADLNGKEDPATKMLTFTFPDLRAVGDLKVSRGPGVYYATAYQRCWRMGTPIWSYIDVQFNLSDEDLKREWYLNLKGLSSIMSGKNYSPISISVNGSDLVDHFEPNRDAWRMDHFKLDRLVAGENTLSIRLQDAITNYWIESLTISPDKQADIRLDTLGGETTVADDASKIKDEAASIGYKLW